MVQVKIRAVNAADPYTRILAMWVDEVPPLSWTVDLERQNSADLKWFVDTGDSVSGVLNVQDGKHDVYIAISQGDNSKLGPWSLETSLDGIQTTLKKVDWNTIGKYSIVVKGGRVISSSEQVNKELSDINKSTPATSVIDSLQHLYTEHQNEVIAAFTIGATITIVLAAAALRKGGKTY